MSLAMGLVATGYWAKTVHTPALAGSEVVEFRGGHQTARSPSTPPDHVRSLQRALMILGAQVEGRSDQNDFAELGYSVTAGREAVRVLDAVRSLVDQRIIGEFVPIGGET